MTKIYKIFNLPRKFNIDRRLTSYSAIIRSGLILKNYAKKILNNRSISEIDEVNLQEYILDKLDPVINDDG